MCGLLCTNRSSTTTSVNCVKCTHLNVLVPARVSVLAHAATMLCIERSASDHPAAAAEGDGIPSVCTSSTMAAHSLSWSHIASYAACSGVRLDGKCWKMLLAWPKSTILKSTVASPTERLKSEARLSTAWDGGGNDTGVGGPLSP